MRRLLSAFVVVMLLESPALSASPLALPPPVPGGDARADTVVLATLRAAAEARDPRAVQPSLLAQAARLRIEAIRAGSLPQVALTAQATVQSDVLTFPIELPAGAEPPREQVRVQIEADWAVYEGGRAALRQDLERARLAEQQSGIPVALYPLREAVTEAFFGALLARSQAETLGLAAEDVAARLELVQARAAEGAALASDAGVLEADLIRLRQRAEEASAQHRAALAVLRDLTGVRLGPDAVLALPRLGAEVERVVRRAAATDLADSLEAGRPEFRHFTAVQNRAGAEARLATAATRPTVSVFGQAGLGRPSPFDVLSDDLTEYALAGVRLRWVPLDWGRSRREAEAARLQAAVARTEAEAFARHLRREVEDEIAEIGRLQDALPQDERVVRLRDDALRVARHQLEEGVLLPDVYTDRLTDLAEARLVRERHRIELARAQARLLSALGRFPEAPRSSNATDR